MLIYLTSILSMESTTSVSLPPALVYWHEMGVLFENKIRDSIQFLRFTSLFVGVAGGGMVYFAACLQGLECNATCIAIMVLIGFSVYNLNRKTDEAEDAINGGDRYRFTKKYEKQLYTAALAGYGLAILLGILNGWMVLFIVLIPLVSGVLYSIPCLPSASGYRRLKEILVVKNLMVGIAWGATLTFIPATVMHASSTQATAITLIFFSSYAFIASTLPDIRDKKGDEQAGIRTIPVVIGTERTLILVTAINLLVGTGAVIFSAVYLPSIVVVLITVSMVYLHLCIQSFTKVERKDILCDILIDGQFLIIGVLAYSLSLLTGSLFLTG